MYCAIKLFLHCESLYIKLRWILRPGIAIRLKFAALSIICVWTFKKLPQTIPYSPDSNTHILGEYDKYLSKRSKSAWTIRVFIVCGSKSNNYSTLMHKTWRGQICLTTPKWPNIIQYLPKCYSIFALIFALRLNTSTANHHILASPTIRLRYQSFSNRFDCESRSGTPLRGNLLYLI